MKHSTETLPLIRQILDAEGNDMAEAPGNWNSIAPYSVKLMGGFEFESDVDDSVPSRSYLAPGHNSASMA